MADWLANQLAAGFVTLVKPTNAAPAPPPESEGAAEKEAGVRSENTPRFTLSEAQRNVFARPSHPSYLGSLAFLASGIAHSLVNRMPTDLREGRGIAWGENSPHLFRFFELMRESPAFQTNVLDRVIAAIPADLRARMDCAPQGGPQDRPDVHQVLALDVGCGAGLAVCSLATRFPPVFWVGLDCHRLSIESAERLAVERGVTSNTYFVEGSAHVIPNPKSLLTRQSLSPPSELNISPFLTKQATAFQTDNKLEICSDESNLDNSATMTNSGFDLVTIIDSLHDMSDPLSVLRSIRSHMKPSGALIVWEPGSRDPTLETMAGLEGELLSALAFSVCGPCGTTGRPDGIRCDSEHLGTIARDEQYFELASRAGFDKKFKAGERVFVFQP